MQSSLGVKTLLQDPALVARSKSFSADPPVKKPRPLSGMEPRAANYCRTSDNVRLNLANVRAKVILIGHWSDHNKKLSHYTFFCCDKIRLQIHSIVILQ